SVAALSPEESHKAFGVKMAKRGVQPVWLKIENREKDPYWLLPISLDPEYFSANEAAQKTHKGLNKDAKARLNRHFNEQQIGIYIPAGETLEGVVYTRKSLGSKDVTVELWGDNDLKRFNFIVPVPGLRLDYQQVDFDHLYPPDQAKNVSLDGLRRALEAYPCCTTNKKQQGDRGDAVNLVIVGDDEDLISAFIRRNWRQTEIRYKGSSLKTLKSFFFKSEYDYSPVSDLYLLGRHQDMAFQKPRRSIHYRNHLRLWQTPLRYQGKPVWIGAISRDIGTRATLKAAFFVTHRIDPDVDETREYLLQDFLAGNSLQAFGYVKGAGETPYENPRKNFMGDEIYTDGLRLVMFLSENPTSILETDMLEWEYPKER
ncbi:MAG: LssY C-terminal domain-containing protein, partial [Candidatus Binatia bacterium]